jgi:hypothetical protein
VEVEGEVVVREVVAVVMGGRGKRYSASPTDRLSDFRLNVVPWVQRCGSISLLSLAR